MNSEQKDEKLAEIQKEEEQLKQCENYITICFHS